MWRLIHPSIRDATHAIVEAGSYDDAIFAAFRFVEGEIQERLTSTSIGEALLSEAFAGDPPRINISPDARDRAGIRQLFSGALSNIRNDRGHKKVPFLPCKTKENCLIHLAFASFLLYLLSKDSNTFPQIQGLRLFGSADQPRAELRGANFGSDAKVLTEEQEFEPVKVTSSLLETLLPAGFSGTLRVRVQDNVSGAVFCDTQLLEQSPPSIYEAVSVDVPLYEDEQCQRRRPNLVGILIRATESGREFIRISPTYPGRYKAGVYVTHGPFERSGVGETWYRNPATGEVCYAWTSSLIATPRVTGKKGRFRLGGLGIQPRRIDTQPGEARTLNVVGWTTDEVVRKEEDVTRHVAWHSRDTAIAFVDGGVLYAKSYGDTKVECERNGLVAAAEVSIANRSIGDRVTYFQGLRRLQQIRFDADDNLYVCNQGPSVFRIDKAGGILEVVRIGIPDTAASGIDCVAVDSARDLYVSDVATRRCLRFPWMGESYGQPSELATVVDGTKKSIAIGPDGTVFVAVMAGHGTGCVVRIDKDGHEACFNTSDLAINLAVDDRARLFMTSRRERRVMVLDHEGRTLASLPYDMPDSPADILVDGESAIYLPFFHSGTLIRLKWDGPRVDRDVVAEGLGTPGGIAMDSEGSVYVSDFAGNSIHKFYNLSRPRRSSK
jgi:sugar lactone lactonase YvrE